MSAQMMAWRLHAYSGLSGISFDMIDRPVAAASEVVVRIYAAGVNPFDWYMTKGVVAEYFRYELPVIIGRDLSGVVEAVGDDVRHLAVGDAVFGQADPAGNGSYAEYIAMDASRLAIKPAGLAHVEAAALPNSLLAAWDGLFSETTGMDLQPGQTILVHGAAGGIGSLVVQLAKWRGAKVIATASSRHETFLADLGVDQYIDYTKVRFEDVAGLVDGVVDTTDAGDLDLRSYPLISKGGTFVAMRLTPSQDDAARHGVRAVFAYGPASQHQFSEMAALAGQGAVRAMVTDIQPITKACEVLERVEAGHLQGKIVLSIRGDELRDGEH